MFKDIPIHSFHETTLGANILLKDYSRKPRYQWSIDDPELNTIQRSSSENNDDNGNDKSDLIITLTPMQIRTFIVKLDGGDRSSEIGLVVRPMYVMLCILVFLILRF